MTPLRWTTTALLGATLIGCVPLPFPIYQPGNAPPFEKHQSFVAPGKVTRAEVIERLGMPHIERRRGRFIGYFGWQQHGAMCLPFVVLLGGIVTPCADQDMELGPLGGPRTLGGPGTVWFMGIELDESGIVTRLDIAHQEPGSQRLCLESQLCLQNFSYAKPGEESIHVFRAIVYAPASEDEAAKRFRNLPDQCLIYVTRLVASSEETYPNDLFPIWLDDRLAGDIAQGNFFLFTVGPGSHKVETTIKEYAGHPRNEGGIARFTCAPGGFAYVRQGDSGRLSVVPESAGRKDVQYARKIIDNL